MGAGRFCNGTDGVGFLSEGAPMSDADIHIARFTGYDAVRILLGLVLLTAAGLKGHQVATEPILETGLLNSRWFLIGVVEFELLFGLWLLVGLYPAATRLAAILCFARLAVVSLAKGLSGESSCGCCRACLCGHLDESVEWFVETPVKIALREGVIVGVIGPRDLRVALKGHSSA